MRVPDKVTTYYESTISLFPVVLKELRYRDMTPLDLWNKTKKKIHRLSDLIDVLDCLCVLGKVVLDEENGVLHYVDRDTV